MRAERGYGPAVCKPAPGIDVVVDASVLRVDVRTAAGISKCCVRGLKRTSAQKLDRPLTLSSLRLIPFRAAVAVGWLLRWRSHAGRCPVLLDNLAAGLMARGRVTSRS
jgi:hypothetical protein